MYFVHYNLQEKFNVGIHILVLLWSKRYVNSIQYVHIKCFMANAIASYAIKYTLYLKHSKLSLNHYFIFIHIVVFIFPNIDSLYIWQSPIIFSVMFTSKNSFVWQEFLLILKKKYCFQKLSENVTCTGYTFPVKNQHANFVFLKIWKAVGSVLWKASVFTLIAKGICGLLAY